MFELLLGILLFAFIINAVFIYQVRTSQPDLYVALGKPNIFSADSANWNVVIYILSGQHFRGATQMGVWLTGHALFVLYGFAFALFMFLIVGVLM